MPDVLSLPLRPEPGPALPSTTAIAEPDRLLGNLTATLSAAGAATWIVLAGGALAALLLVLVVWRRARRGGLARTGRVVAGPLVLAWEAQGVYQLARLMDVPGPAAAVFACVTAVVLITLGAQADEHHQRHGVLGPAMRLMWLVAVPMGLVVALSAHTWAERALRIVLPVLAGVVFVSYYLPDEPADGERKRKQGGFRYTPRRVAVRLGLFEATDADIDTVNRQRLVRQMTDLEFARRNGSWEWLRDRRAVRLSRLSLTATDDVVAEVRANVARAGWCSPVELPPAGGWAKLLPRLRGRQLFAALEAEHAERVEVAARLAAVLAEFAESERARSEQASMLAEHLAAVEAERFRAESAERAAADAEQRAASLAEQLSAVRGELRRAAAKPARSGGGKKAAERPVPDPEQRPGAPRLSDPEAVALMLAEHPEQSYEWKPREVHRLTGAGFGRIPKLIELVAERHAERAAGAASDDSAEQSA